MHCEVCLHDQHVANGAHNRPVRFFKKERSVMTVLFWRVFLLVGLFSCRSLILNIPGFWICTKLLELSQWQVQVKALSRDPMSTFGTKQFLFWVAIKFRPVITPECQLVALALGCPVERSQVQTGSLTPVPTMPEGSMSRSFKRKVHRSVPTFVFNILPNTPLFDLMLVHSMSFIILLIPSISFYVMLALVSR